MDNAQNNGPYLMLLIGNLFNVHDEQICQMYTNVRNFMFRKTVLKKNIQVSDTN
jgi:hypothetical protein